MHIFREPNYLSCEEKALTQIPFINCLWQAGRDKRSPLYDYAIAAHLAITRVNKFPLLFETIKEHKPDHSAGVIKLIMLIKQMK